MGGDSFNEALDCIVVLLPNYIIIFEGLSKIRILYSRITLVFDNKNSSNGKDGGMMLLSLLLLAKKQVVIRDLDKTVFICLSHFKVRPR